MVDMREASVEVAENALRDKPLIVACIPAYNEESSIAGVLVRARGYVDEVLVCDDGSTDLTGDIARGLGARVLRHEGNMGYGSSLRNMFREALEMGADIVVTLDGDGQHDPTQIPTLVNTLEEADIVVGSRFLDGGESDAPDWRHNGIKFITSLTSGDEFGVTDAQSGFRAYSSQALRALNLTESGMGISTEILLKAKEKGLKISEAPIKVTYNGEFSRSGALLQGLDVVGSTIKHHSIQHPLQFYGIPSVVLLLVGVVFGAWALEIFRVEGRLVTNLTLISVTSVIMGLIFLTTGIILYTVISVIREGTR